MAHDTARHVLKRAIMEIERDRDVELERLNDKEEDIAKLKKSIAIRTSEIEKIKKSIEALEKV